MSITNDQVAAIRAVFLPDVWTINSKNGPVAYCHLACEAELSPCRASAFQSFRGKFVRWQLSIPPETTVMLESHNHANDLFDKADRVLRDGDFSISSETIIPSAKAEWVKHPKRSNCAPGEIAALALSSWDGALLLTEEKRSVSQHERRLGFRCPQVGALHAIAAHWSVSSKPATIVMPTGTGKTEVMLACMIMRRPQRLLVLVPSDALRLQTFTKFVQLGILFKIGVIPQSTIRPVVGRVTQTLSECDIDALKQCNVVVSTVAALQGLSSALLRRFLAQFDTVFFDEAHHTPSMSWDRLYENLSDKIVLLFTATPFRLDGHRIPGRIIYNFPLRLAQAQGYFRPICFRDVFEPDISAADSKIAEAAVNQLRSDLAAGFEHLLLARADTTDRAETLFHNIYARYADLNPTLIHSRVKGYSRILESIKAGNHKVIVCVDMFGEGLDLPLLKIAALHDPYKSLGITLQFTGRFTRDAANIGNATVVANVADLRVSDAIEELYAEDSDWNELIPTLSAKAIQSQVDFSDFLDRMERSVKGDETAFDLNVLRPKTSTVIFKATQFSPAMFRKAVRKGAHVEREWHSRDKDLLIFITRSKCPIEWATIREVSDEIWNLFVVAYDRQRKLLFIHGSQKGPFYHDLARAVSGEDATLLNGERMFRAFHGINRLIFHNVGLYNRGTRLRYRMYTGLDVGEAINPAIQIGATKSNLFAVGYDGGQRVSVGASDKGKVWSMASSSIPDWISWCGMIADKILDDRIATDAFLKHTLIPREVAQLPDYELFSACFPSEWYSSEMESASLCEETLIRSVHTLGISDCRVIDTTHAELSVCSEGGPCTTFRLTWGPDEGKFAVEQILGPVLTLRQSGSSWGMDEYLRDHPPTLMFMNGSELTGARLLEVEQVLSHTYDPSGISVGNWAGTDIRVESKWKCGQCRKDAIQSKMLEKLVTNNNQFVFDDDDAGEIADIVEIAETHHEVIMRFYHCKYSSGDEPGKRVKDLYEVCGQAVRSVRWTTDPVYLLNHLLHRESPSMLNGRASRFEKGDLRSLVGLKRRLRKVRVRYEIAIVQPGLSISSLDSATSTILGAANAFILDITGSPLYVVASA